MPFLNASALGDDPAGMALLRSVLASSRHSCRPARAPSWTRARAASSMRQARASDSVAADLIVVGSHRPTMSTYLLGSNAATIVLVVR